jgi:hypothetical protein
MTEQQPLTESQLTCRNLNQARRNYRLAVRWYREVLAYRGTVRGDEWKQECEEGWLAEDAEFAYNEVIDDIKRYRESISSLTAEWQKLKEEGK